MESSIQVKVEYGPEKWVNFFVKMSRVSSGEYTFVKLMDDIVQHCPVISHLNATNIRIRYQDDEGSYINLIFSDEYVFKDMWDNTKTVADREYKRIKIKEREMDPQCNVPSGFAPAVVHKQIDKRYVRKPRQLYSLPEKNDYEYLSAERKKKNKSYSDEYKPYKEEESSNSVLNVTGTMLKTQVERLFDDLENNINEISRQIESKQTELDCFNESIQTTLTRNDGALPVCSQCHLREGHTKRNCRFGVCLTVKSCWLNDRHPNKKAERRKIESELVTLKISASLKEVIEQKKHLTLK